MKARLINITSVLNGGFIFPKPDLGGNCDNFQSPSFMENSNTNCNQRFNLSSQCLNLANPSIYTNELLVYTGLSAFFSQIIPVTVSALYFYDNSTKAYTNEADLTKFQNSSLKIDADQNC
jgi:hypothetical protein